MNVIDFIRSKHADVDELIRLNGLETSCYFYLNPFNYFFYRKTPSVLNDSTFYMVDGMFLVHFFNLTVFGGDKIKRQSFDMTSIAPKVLKYCEETRKSVFFAGGTESEVEKFISIMCYTYKDIIVAGYSSGYDSVDQIKKKVVASKPDVIILGLGNIKQEMVASEMHREYSAAYFTCGAFISQVGGSGKKDYFPRIINKFNLRWLYRFYKEPRVIKRVFLYYPAFILAFLKDLYCVKKK